MFCREFTLILFNFSLGKIGRGERKLALLHELAHLLLLLADVTIIIIPTANGIMHFNMDSGGVDVLVVLASLRD